ncbi:MAG: hypothetical protein HRT90_07015 [Candidatus Margulisbacteria bacterium]|nr:hypothetical protein [Candidatus Margulisiibacteriota bacterium]
MSALEFNTIEDLPRLQSSLQDIASIQTQITTIQNDLSSQISTFQKEVAAFSNSIKDLDRIKQADFQAISALLNLGNLQTDNIGNMFIEPLVRKRLDQGFAVIKLARHAFPQSHKKEQKDHMNGTTIYFQKENALPTFWIKSITLSGKSQSKRLSGQIDHISSNQTLSLKPTRVLIKGKGFIKPTTSYSVNIWADHRNKPQRETFKAAFNDYPLPPTNVYHNNDISLSLSRAVAGVKGTLSLVDDQLSGNISIQLRELSFLGTGVESASVESIILSILNQLSSIQINIAFSGTMESPEINISSNLDTRLSKGLQHVLIKRIQGYKKELLSELTGIVNRQSTDIQHILSSHSLSIDDQFDSRLGILENFNTLFINEMKILENQSQRINPLKNEKGGINNLEDILNRNLQELF